MLIDPDDLASDLDTLEAIEKASLRLVCQAIVDFRGEAIRIFQNEKDLVQDIGEDITREALDRMGVSKIDDRLFGKIDYKRARYVFHPEYTIRQALFVDSKAEEAKGQRTATLQTAQTSLRIRQIKGGKLMDEAGKLPTVSESAKGKYLTTTIFVKYNYRKEATQNRLDSIIVSALPNGMLQEESTEDSASSRSFCLGRRPRDKDLAHYQRLRREVRARRRQTRLAGSGTP